MDAVLRQALILRPLPQFFPCLALCGWPPPGTLECGAVRWGGGATPILPHKAGCVRVCFPLARPRDSLCHLQVFGTHRKPMVFTSLGERQPVFLSLSLSLSLMDERGAVVRCRPYALHRGKGLELFCCILLCGPAGRA